MSHSRALIGQQGKHFSNYGQKQKFSKKIVKKNKNCEISKILKNIAKNNNNNNQNPFLASISKRGAEKAIESTNWFNNSSSKQLVSFLKKLEFPKIKNTQFPISKK